VSEFVTIEVDASNRVATIRLERPPMNALSRQVWSELAAAADEVSARADIGAAVIWGGPKIFAAGADIKEFPDYDYQDVKEFGRLLQESLAKLSRIPKVVIAAVNGYALGGGCELSLTADFRLCADNAKFGQPEILLGLIPGAGGTQRLTRIVGVSRAKDIVMSGRMVDALEAVAIGLASAWYPADDVYPEAVALAARYASGPYALRLAKQAIDDGSQLTLDQALRLESTLFAECFATDDARVGITSFIEHGPGKATFAGR